MSSKSRDIKKNKDSHRRIYQVLEIADSADPRCQTAAGGDVFGAIAGGFEHFLRSIVQMLPGSCSAELLFIYGPGDKDKNSQERLTFYVQLEASDSETASNLDNLLKGGPISCFYNFEVTDKISDIKQLHASCEVLRKMDYLKPLHSCDVNPKIPDSYCTISSFVPNKGNDYMMLDRVLDCITEPVKISIMVKPVDISPQIHAHTTYMANLANINRWDTDYEEFGGIDYTGSSDHLSLRSQGQVKLLNHSEPMAKDVLQTERQIHKTLPNPHLSFRIKVKAETKSVALLVASTVAEGAFEDGSYHIINDEKNEKGTKKTVGVYRKESGALTCSSVEHVDGDTESEYEQLRPLSRVCPVEELLGGFRLPIASSAPLCCRKNTDPPHINEKELLFLGHKEQSLAGGGRPIPLGISVNELVKHLATFGLPGSGKTTSNMGLLYQLNALGVPFMVIECRKKEYRVMKMLKKHKNANVRKLAKKLRFYTPGSEHISPFQLNPLRVPHDITIAEHIERLKSDIKASIPLSAGSLPALLGEALEKVYEDYPDRKRPPVMTDLIAAIEVVLASKGYSAETRSDMQTAIEVRLGILAQAAIGKIFQSRHGISIEQLMAEPSLFELGILQRQEACLFVLSLFSKIFEYLGTNPPPAKGLRYVIMIEEAHLIFGSNNDRSASEEIADTASALSDIISEMLVTFRSLGVAIILSSQHPTKLDSAASQSVGSMQTFRQIYGPDCEELASSMRLKSIDVQDLARLTPGEAFFITTGYFEPQRIRTPDIGKELPLFPPPSDQELLSEICEEEWFQEAKAGRIYDGLSQLKEHMDKFDLQREYVNNRVKKLLDAYESLLDQKQGQYKKQRLAAIVQSLRTLRGKLISSYNKFKKGPFKRFSYLFDELEGQEDDLRAFGESLNRRFESVIKLDTEGILVMMDRLMKKCEHNFKETAHAKKK